MVNSLRWVPSPSVLTTCLDLGRHCLALSRHCPSSEYSFHTREDGYTVLGGCQDVLRLQDHPMKIWTWLQRLRRLPDFVREALLEAIRHVQLQSTDITLLWIENVFQSTLKKPWKEPKILRPVLEACRQGKLKGRTECLFYEHGKEYAIVALCAATKADGHRLFREIDLLGDEELIRLIGNIKKIPKKATIIEFIEDFVLKPGRCLPPAALLLTELTESIVSNPPPQMARPRTRKKGL